MELMSVVSNVISTISGVSLTGKTLKADTLIRSYMTDPKADHAENILKCLITQTLVNDNKIEDFLPEYMALLWLTDPENNEKRKNAKLAIVDYYEKKLCLYGYRTDNEGE